MDGHAAKHGTSRNCLTSDMNTIGLEGQMPTLPNMVLPELPNFDMSAIGMDGWMATLPNMALPELPNFDMNTIGLEGQMPTLPNLNMPQLNANIPELPNFDMSQLNTDLAGLGDFDLSQLNTNLPVGPVPTAGAGGGQISLSIQIDRIEINAPGGDPEDIAEQVGDQLQIQSRQLVEEIDSMVRA